MPLVQLDNEMQCCPISEIPEILLVLKKFRVIYLLVIISCISSISGMNDFGYFFFSGILFFRVFFFFSGIFRGFYFFAHLFSDCINIAFEYFPNNPRIIILNIFSRISGNYYEYLGSTARYTLLPKYKIYTKNYRFFFGNSVREFYFGDELFFRVISRNHVCARSFQQNKIRIIFLRLK